MELTKLGYKLYELYEMSVKEMLFELKYAREGKAYNYWKIGMAVRIGFNAKNYPRTPKDMSPELFEKAPIVKMPDWLKYDYSKEINNQFNRR